MGALFEQAQSPHYFEIKNITDEGAGLLCPNITSAQQLSAFCILNCLQHQYFSVTVWCFVIVTVKLLMFTKCIFVAVVFVYVL